MPVSKTLAGTVYQIPERNERRWGAQLTAFLSKAADILALLSGGVSGTPVVAWSTAASTLAAAATLTKSATIHRLTGSGGAVTLNTTTPIAAGTVDGEILVLEGAHATNTVTIQESGNVDINGDWTSGLGRMLTLIWNSTRVLWVEHTRTI